MAARITRVTLVEPPDPDEEFVMHKGHLSRGELNHLVSRLSRATTAHAMRSRLWSRDRKDYEQRHASRTASKTKDDDEDDDSRKLANLPKMYPDIGAQADEETIKSIVEKVNKPTHSSQLRAKNKTEHFCQRFETPKTQCWQSKPKSKEEAEEITKRLLAGTFIHELRERDARFMRASSGHYYIKIPENNIKLTDSFIRGGMYYTYDF